MFAILAKLHGLLTKEQKRTYILLQVVFAITAVIQVAGIASLAPFIALVSNPQMIHDNKITQFVFDYIGFANDIDFLIFFALGVITFIVVSNAIGAFAVWFSVTFSQNLGLDIQDAIYKSYLNKEYVYYSKNNSSQMIAMITQEAPRFTYMVLQPLLNLISQLFVVVIIATGLIIIDPIIAVVALIAVGSGYVGIFKTIKARLTHHGLQFHEANTTKLRLLNESLGGIKEVKLLGTEQMYEKELAAANFINARAQAVIAMFGDLPRFVIETLAFCALLGLAIYLLGKHGNSAQIISVLSLYAMAGYKLLPAAQTIFKSASQIKANRSAMDALYPEAMEGRAVPHRRADTVIMPIPHSADIQFIDASFCYPEADAPALQNIDLTIKKNSLVAFVGPSGAGKSTLADLVLGFLLPSQGRMLIGDIEITASNKRSWQTHLGYVPQNIFLVDDTIIANIAFGVPRDEVDMDKVKTAAKMANIDQFVEGLPEQYAFVVGERGAMLSGGQKQRIGIARALYHDADVLVLDEATSALDNITEREIIATIVKLKTTKTIVMIAHRLSTIRNADEIIFLERGTIADRGSFDQLSLRNDKFRAMIQSTSATEQQTSENITQ